jgi:acyl-CoA thioesterase YciA
MALLDLRNVRNVDIARAIDLSADQISKVRIGKRRLTLDEAARLSRAFSLETRTPNIRVTAMPADTNPYGGVFGGWLMSQMALGAGSLASRVARGKCVVVAADELRFPGAMAVGDELSVYAAVVKQGRTSLRIAVEAVARERDGEQETTVASGQFTFVALDKQDKPRMVAAEEMTNG